jgi:hypothetical protein
MKNCLAVVIAVVVFIAGVITGARGCDIVGAADEWVTPDYAVANGWSSADNSHDDNTGTRADETVMGYSWSNYLELWLNEAVTCDKVRWYYYGDAAITQVRIDVYYNDSWHNIYEGDTTKNQWVEYEVGSEESIDGTRISLYNSSSIPRMLYCYEVDFWSIEPEPEPATLELTPASDTNYVNSNHTLTATLWDDGSELMAGVSLNWSIEVGVGWFEDYDSTTDGSGQAQAVITSNITGNTTVKCWVTDYPDVYDTAIKYWESEPPPEEFAALPIWLIALIGVLLAVATYVNNPIMTISCITLLIVCLEWLTHVGLSDVSYLLATCALYCGVGYCLILIIQGGEKLGFIQTR